MISEVTKIKLKDYIRDTERAADACGVTTHQLIDACNNRESSLIKETTTNFKELYDLVIEIDKEL